MLNISEFVSLNSICCMYFIGTDKRKLVVIGKSAKPRCFKGVRSLPVDYFNNKNAWMTSDIFKRILLAMDKEMIEKRRKILLFLDNCAAHGKIEDMQKSLKAIKLSLLPPNTTSHLQPLDQGIIHCLKSYYRSKMLELVISDLEEGLPIRKVNVLEAITIVASSWSVDVTSETIANCFRKAGFVKSVDDAEDCDTIDVGSTTSQPLVNTFIQLTNETTNVNAGDYAQVDDAISTTYVHVNDEEIVQDILNPGGESSDDEDDVAPAIGHTISQETVTTAVYQIRHYLMQNSEVSVDLFNKIDCIDQFVSKNKLSLRQSTITTFFKPSTDQTTINMDHSPTFSKPSNDESTDSPSIKSNCEQRFEYFFGTGDYFSFEEQRFAYISKNKNTNNT